MKTCPFCAEEIQDAAIVCKHCGRDLHSAATIATDAPITTTTEPTTTEPTTTEPTPVVKARPRHRLLALIAAAGGFLLSIVVPTAAVVGVFLIWLGIGFGLKGNALIRWGGGFVAALFLAALGTVLSDTSGSTSTTSRTISTSTTSSEPDEPCRVEAPDSGREAAQNWCQGGVFTLVNVKNDANNFVVLLQFSRKGQRLWAGEKYTVLNRFRRITDEMVEKTDLNAAFSLFDTNGQMLGGCVRQRGARESTCK